jgi:hypothetical protein
MRSTGGFMSAHWIAVSNGSSAARGTDLAALREKFWKWWIGLYAEQPRKLRPLI